MPVNVTKGTVTKIYAEHTSHSLSMPVNVTKGKVEKIYAEHTSYSFGMPVIVPKGRVKRNVKRKRRLYATVYHPICR